MSSVRNPCFIFQYSKFDLIINRFGLIALFEEHTLRNTLPIQIAERLNNNFNIMWPTDECMYLRNPFCKTCLLFYTKPTSPHLPVKENIFYTHTHTHARHV